jgi:hypothetical protein
MDSAGIEHGPSLVESGRSTNEPWKLYILGFLGSIWQHAHSHVLADFFQYFWRIFQTL